MYSESGDEEYDGGHLKGCNCSDKESSDEEEEQPEVKRQRLRASSLLTPEERILPENLPKMGQMSNPSIFHDDDDDDDQENGGESMKETPQDAQTLPMPTPVAPVQNRLMSHNVTFVHDDDDLDYRDGSMNTEHRRRRNNPPEAPSFLDWSDADSSSSASDPEKFNFTVQLPSLSDLSSSSSDDVNPWDDPVFRDFVENERPSRTDDPAGHVSNVYQNELELASIADSELDPNPLENFDSSSDDDYQENPAPVEMKVNNDEEAKQEDKEEFADEELESDEKGQTSPQFDSEMTSKRPCLKCQSLTSSVSRYCLRCFLARRNWLPERPKNRKRSRRGSDPEFRTAFMNTGPFSPQLNTSSPAFSDLGVVGMHENLTSTSSSSLHSHADLDFQPPPPISIPLTPDEKRSAVKSSTPRSTGDDGICNICYVREKDAAFVHNKIAHSYSCFYCADRILKKSGKCPICRAKVLRVVRIISM